MITSVALPYQIYHETHSTLMVGLLSLVQLLPLLFTALLGGVFADRYHRLMLLLSSELILCLRSLVLMLYAYSASPSVGILFVTSAIMSAFNGLHRPALESIVQQLVPKHDYPAVAALSTFKFSLCMIAGPALGGLLIASAGLVLTYFADVLSFVMSLTALLYAEYSEAGICTSGFTVFTDGFQYAFRARISGHVCGRFIAMVFGMPSALFQAIRARRSKDIRMLYQRLQLVHWSCQLLVGGQRINVMARRLPWLPY